MSPPEGAARSLGRLSAALAVIVVAGKLLGFVREVLLTLNFGATGETDAFYLVFTLVVLISSTFMVATPKVLVPRYHAVAKESGPEAANTVVLVPGLVFVAILGVLALAVAGFAPAIVAFTARRFDAESAALAVRLLRLLAPVLPLYGIAGVMNALAQARGHFYLVELAALSLNVGAVGGLLLWAKTMGIASVALGILIGIACQATLVCLYPLLQRIRPRRGTGSLQAAPRLVGSLVLLVFVSQTGGSAALLVDRYFAALLPEGHFSCMGYAQRLMVLPQSVLYSSVLVAVLPPLSAAAAAGRAAEVERLASRAMRMLLFLMAPLACGLAAAADPVVRLAFGRGAFGAEAIALTASLVVCYVPSVIAEVVRTPLATVLLGHGRVAATLWFGVLRIVLMLALYPFVWERWGAHGLVLTLGGIDAICAGTMLVACRRLTGVRFEGLGAWAVRGGAATAAAMAVAAAGVAVLGQSEPTGATLGLGLAVVVATSALMFRLAARWLQLPEVDDLNRIVSALRTRIGGGRGP